MDRLPWLVPMRMARSSDLHFSTSGVNSSAIFSSSSWYAASESYSRSSNFLIPSAKFPGLTRIFSNDSAIRSAVLGLKWMSATSGVS